MLTPKLSNTTNAEVNNESNCTGKMVDYAKQFDEATLQGDAPKLKTLVQEVEKDI